MFLFRQGGQPASLHCGAVRMGRVGEGTMPLARLSPCFQSRTLLPTTGALPLAAPVLIPQVSELVCVLGFCGPLKRTLPRDWQFLPLAQLPQVFTARVMRLYFPGAGTLGCMVCPGLGLLAPGFYLHVKVGPYGPSSTISLHVLSAPAAHLHPSYRSGWTFLL